jgi:quinol monooxygenase YgiN
MIVRIVRMTLRQEEVATFKLYFAESFEKIRNFEGCTNLELFEDADESNIICTYSYWLDQQHLDNYRNSELFKSTWKKVKPLFASPAVAFSLKKTAY